jgi:adenylate cyclase
VIREAFDQNEQVFKQRTVFRNAKPNTNTPTLSAKSAAPARRAAPPPARAASRPASQSPSKPAAHAEPGEDSARLSAIKRGEPAFLRHTYAVVKRLLIAVGAGLLLSGIVVVFLLTPTGARLIGYVPERAVYGGIVLLFVASFLVSLYLFNRAGPSVRMQRPTAAPASAESTSTEPAAQNWADRELPIGAPPAEEEAPAPQPASAAEKAEVAELAAPEKPAEPEKPPEAAVRAAEELPAAGSTDRETLLRFFRDAMMHASTQAYVADGKMAPHNRFGCHLYLLGAGRTCLAANGSDPAMLGPVLQSALELLGSDAQRARSFIAKEDEYAKDPKYKGMIQVGAKAMDRFLSGQSAAAALGQALKAWNTTDAADPQGDNIAIMFTDMVSSVETTQALGDQGMMKLVQTHNLIVGSVLKTHRGHQVKHTGDGIMAVFPRVADGVAAAGEIQRQIAEHNRVTASSYLKVRMGLAVGQPIRDQDDYFGTVVQLAARLCACAGEAEICVANAIVEQVAGTKRFTFSDVRDVKLKGFADAQKMRFLLWEQARATAPAAE